MDKTKATKVVINLLDPLERLYGGLTEEWVKEFVGALGHYPADTLTKAYKRVVRTHRAKTMPSLAFVLEACREEHQEPIQKQKPTLDFLAKDEQAYKIQENALRELRKSSFFKKAQSEGWHQLLWDIASNVYGVQSRVIAGCESFGYSADLPCRQEERRRFIERMKDLAVEMKAPCLRLSKEEINFIKMQSGVKPDN